MQATNILEVANNLKNMSDEHLYNLLYKIAINLEPFYGELSSKIECFQNTLKIVYKSPKIHELTRDSIKLYLKGDGIILFKKLLHESTFVEEWKVFLVYVSKNFMTLSNAF